MAVLEGKYLIASGPVIIEGRKILVNKDDKDEFYKIPGGSISEGIGDLEKACHIKVKEEINGEIEIIKPLHPKILWKNPQTKEKMTIILTSYLAKLKNKEKIKPMGSTTEIKWLDLDKIEDWKYTVSPYMQFLIEKGDIK
ncbi:MAG: NUDIX domain-containing protein [archaeon]